MDRDCRTCKYNGTDEDKCYWCVRHDTELHTAYARWEPNKDVPDINVGEIKVKKMNELIKWAVQSEGFANAIQKGYVVRAWIAEKDGYDDVLVIRMAGEWFSIENFFTDKADRKYVEDRIMRMFRSIARYYDERLIDS